MASLEWENVSSNNSGIAQEARRARVPGGWLILVNKWENPTYSGSYKDINGTWDFNFGSFHNFDTPSVTFVPDPNHEWQ